MELRQVTKKLIELGVVMSNPTQTGNQVTLGCMYRNRVFYLTHYLGDGCSLGDPFQQLEFPIRKPEDITAFLGI